METILLIALTAFAGGYFLIEVSRFFVKLFNLMIKVFIPFLIITIFMIIGLPKQEDENEVTQNSSKRESLTLELYDFIADSSKKKVNISPQENNNRNRDIYIYYIPHHMNQDQIIVDIRSIFDEK